MDISNERQKVLCKIDELQFKIDNYDEIYSDAIEYETTKDELIYEQKRLQQKLKYIMKKV